MCSIGIGLPSDNLESQSLPSLFLEAMQSVAFSGLFTLSLAFVTLLFRLLDDVLSFIPVTFLLTASHGPKVAAS